MKCVQHMKNSDLGMNCLEVDLSFEFVHDYLLYQKTLVNFKLLED